MAKKRSSTAAGFPFYLAITLDSFFQANRVATTFAAMSSELESFNLKDGSPEEHYLCIHFSNAPHWHEERSQGG